MDAASFKTAIGDSLDRMYRAALYLCGNEADASDAVQEACMKLWQRRHDLDDVENFTAYAVGATRNACINALKKRDYHADIDTLPAVADTADTAADYERREQLGCIMAAVQRLPENQRMVMTMRDIDGCSIDEISSVTGLTGGNIRVLLCRARSTIRNFFNK